MRLYIPTMDAVLVDADREGRVQFEGEDWMLPNLQERRAILHAAKELIAELDDLVNLLERQG